MMSDSLKQRETTDANDMQKKVDLMTQDIVKKISNLNNKSNSQSNVNDDKTPSKEEIDPISFMP